VSRLLLVHVLLSGGEVVQVLGRLGDVVQGNVLSLNVKPNALQELNDLLTLVCGKTIVVVRGHVDSELLLSLGVAELGDAVQVFDLNATFYFLGVDVVQGLLSND